MSPSPRKYFLSTFALFTFTATSVALAAPALQLRAGVQHLPAQTGLRSAIRQQRTLYVVQFKAMPTDADRAHLEQAGLEILRYLPDQAYLVRLKQADFRAARGNLSVLAKLPSVAAMGAFPAAWKVAPELVKKAARAAGGRMSAQVALFDDASAQAFLAKLTAQVPQTDPIAVEQTGGRFVQLEASYSALRSLLEWDEVEWIEPTPTFVRMDVRRGDFEPSPADGHAMRANVTGLESGTRLMGFDGAWSRGFSGAGEIAAMADTGLDTGDQNTLMKDFEHFHSGFPFGFFSTSWKDAQGHGTHVAGSILGTGQTSQGQFKGGAYSANLVIESLWSDLFANLMFGTDFKPILTKAFAAGARVHSNSWGNPNALGVYDQFSNQMDDFAWNNPEMLIVFAAGNSGADANKDGVIDEGSVTSPGTAKNTLTVGASENLVTEGGLQKLYGAVKDPTTGALRYPAEPLASDNLSNNENGMAAFSSRGPTLDGRLKPEIVAPGTNILSTRSHVEGAEPLWGEYDADHVWSGGTSMATPLTAGAATVTREFLTKAYSIAKPMGATVKAFLIHTAKDLYPGQYPLGPKQEFAKPRPNVQEGYGRVDMDALTASNASTSVFESTAGVAQGASDRYALSVMPGQRVRATLVYFDAPATPSAAKALVNDLDLSLNLQGGAALVSLNDHTNNQEMIEWTATQPMSLEAVVSGTAIPQGKAGKQPYSLILTVY